MYQDQPVDNPVRPFLLSGSKGPLWAIYYPPAAAAEPAGDILVAPAFAEEMNRCRAMVALQARAFARIGVGTLVLDPYGTGDSAGNFEDASWEIWRDDLARGIEWLRQSANGCRALWGIRLGAIMAAELAARDAAIERLLFWQPVANGKTYFTQFLRIRIAAEIDARGGIKSTEELRRRAAEGDLVEVSGYQIAPELARRLDEVRLPDAQGFGARRLTWYEVLATADAPHGNAKLIDGYKASGMDLVYESVVGPPFWQLHERTVAPALVEATTLAVADWGRAPANSAADACAAPDTQISDDPSASAPERPLVFHCASEQLIGVLHRGDPSCRRGIVIVVAGGPQYRAGAHRQFVALARRLASRGYPVLRFDLRGMGDSSGDHLGYQHSAPDIRTAIDALIDAVPQVEEIVLFGECESASGILFYAYQDSRAKGLVLVNPWVRTEEGRAEVLVKHYYLQRVMSASFWKKVRAGGFRPGESLSSLAKNVRGYLGVRKIRALSDAASGPDPLAGLPLPIKTAAGLRRFGGPVMILMSGKDYIAKEFDEIARSSKAWRGLLEEPRISRQVLDDADHTFSREVWKVDVAKRVTSWLESW